MTAVRNKTVGTLTYPEAMDDLVRDMADIQDTIKNINRQQYTGTADFRVMRYLKTSEKVVEASNEILSEILGTHNVLGGFEEWARRRMNDISNPDSEKAEDPPPDIGVYTELALMMTYTKSWINSGYMMLLPPINIDEIFVAQRPPVQRNRNR